MTTVATVLETPVKLPLKYRVWLAGALASLLGDACLNFGLAWAATAHGGGVAALVLTMVNLPRATLLLVGGVYGDRLGARRIMILGDGIMLAATIILALVVLVSGTPVWLLLGAGLVIGIIDAFYLPASGSMPRRLVGQDLLPRALALRQTGSQLVTLVGAPLGGLMVVAVGLDGAALVDAVTFGIVFIVLIAIKDDGHVANVPQRRGVLREAADGVKVSLADPVLRPALAITAGAAGFLLPVGSLLIPLLARSHHWAAAAAGWTLGGQSFGIIAVSLAVVRFGRLGRPGLVTAVALLIAALGIVALSIAPTAPLAVFAAVCVGAGSGLLTTHLGPLLLGAAPQSHLSRVQALLTLVQSLTLLIMNNVIGNTARLAGPVAGLWLSAGVLTAIGLTGLGSRGLRTAVLPRSGR
jgi:hypothetical protein